MARADGSQQKTLNSLLYLQTSREISSLVTKRFSTSFSTATRLLPKDTRLHIAAIYGFTRFADEIVDTYSGADMRKLLDDFEAETKAAIKRGYSTNPILHAFQNTANIFGIDASLIEPFFTSMRMDLELKRFTKQQYQTYIHGSAEVVGLMCLTVFCGGRNIQYDELADGAKHLGAAYQKVNFLRDCAADYEELGRCYFPGVTYKNFSEKQKQAIIADIHNDFSLALPAMQKLPGRSKQAVAASYRYFLALLYKLEATPIEEIKERRVRISNTKKLLLLAVPTK